MPPAKAIDQRCDRRLGGPRDGRPTSGMIACRVALTALTSITPMAEAWMKHMAVVAQGRHNRRRCGGAGLTAARVDVIPFNAAFEVRYARGDDGRHHQRDDAHGRKRP